MNLPPIALGALCIVKGAALLSACTSVPIQAEQCRADSAISQGFMKVLVDGAALCGAPNWQI